MKEREVVVVVVGKEAAVAHMGMDKEMVKKIVW